MRSRLDRLTELIDVTEGRVPEELTARAAGVLERADQRLQWGEQTVVALAGSTGSGKSSLTNSLTGSDVAVAGVLRPTTAETLAVSFGVTNVQLLDWLQVSRRHEVPGSAGFEGLVLLDLPDHDSMAASHRAEVDRLMPLVDQFVWVLDPQKYADAAVHRGYLTPLSAHREVVAVVLNQVDRLRMEDLDDCVGHLDQLLSADGLPGVPLFATSIATGLGLEALRKHLAGVVAAKSAARTRLSVDLTQLAGDFDAASHAGPEKLSEEDIAVLEAGLAEAAGVPRMIEVVAEGIRRRGVLATGWPMTRWVHRLRPDPLRRLRPGSWSPADGAVDATEISPAPDYGPVALAQLRITLRQLSDSAGQGLGTGWQGAVASACRRDLEQLPALLAEAVSATDLEISRIPVWWRVVQVFQWFLMVMVALGLGWLIFDVVLAWFGLHPAPGGVGTLSLPALLSLGGVAGGLLLSALSRGFVAAGERATMRRAAHRLHSAVAEVGREHVVVPLTAELGRLAEARRLVRGLQK